MAFNVKNAGAAANPGNEPPAGAASDTVAQPVDKAKQRYSVTARELIVELANLEDLDATVQISFFGSNPCNLQEVAVEEDTVVLSGGM